jgi:hypothetical protein
MLGMLRVLHTFVRAHRNPLRLVNISIWPNRSDSARAKPVDQHDLKTIFQPPFYLHNMTTADFIALCFWPLTAMFTVLLLTVRERALKQYLARAAGVVAVAYLVLSFFYSRESLIAVVDQYILMGLIGLVMLWYAALPMGSRGTGESRMKRFGVFIAGIGAMALSGTVLYQDFVRPRVVLEGRASNLLVTRRDYKAQIDGRSVKATRVVFERLKLLPYVRVEVGRGSDYIFKIDYLAN